MGQNVQDRHIRTEMDNSNMSRRSHRFSHRFGIGLASIMLISAISGMTRANAQMAMDKKGKDAAGGMMEMPMGHGDMKFYMAPRTKASARFQRTINHYAVPAGLVLRDQHGDAIDLAAELAKPGPVVLQFIFTSCATICPVLSASISQAQDELLKLAPDVRLISVSIDPTYDTPERLAAYARRYHAGSNWRFVTGTPGEVRKVIGSFDALLRSNNKMYHRPYNYLRGADPQGPWTRLEGLIPKRILLDEFAKVIAGNGKSAPQAAVEESRAGED